jgi:hypothetical protein
MNNNNQNYKITPKVQEIKEPTIHQETTQTQKNEELLDKLLQLALKQSEEGKTIPHAVVMARIKEKYNLKF